jgi:hypothetical protein
MSADVVYELIGYLGSALVVISLAMSSIIRLRVINLAGAVVFAVYGALIGSIPIVVTNVIIAILNVSYLTRELRTREDLTVIPVGRDDPFFDAFVNRYRSDLEPFIDRSRMDAESEVRYVMMRNEIPAGIFVGTSSGDGVLDVVIDYVSPPYRDYRSGACLYHDCGTRFADLGYEAVRVQNVHMRQRSYFTEMGFQPASDGSLLLTLSER